MAEAIFNISGKNAVAASAGLFAGSGRASENAILATKEYGVDLGSHNSRQLTTGMLDNSDVVLAMTMNHKFNIPEKYRIRFCSFTLRSLLS